MNLVVDKYRGKIQEVRIGSKKPVVVGGDMGLPFLHFEAVSQHRPAVALEITDRKPDWPLLLLDRLRITSDPVAWAKSSEDRGADVVCLRMVQSGDDAVDPGERIATVGRVLDALEAPLMVVGTGDRDHDNAVLPLVAREFAGSRLLLGPVTQENYEPIVRACVEHGHSVIAQSPIDINICKQLNILVSDAGLPLDRIVIDPTTGALGYGIEYTYSIMEKARLAALSGDRLLACPQVCFVGQETWKLKETVSIEPEIQAWGDVHRRGTVWEAAASAALLVAGAHILVIRDPEALALVRRHTGILGQWDGV